MPVKCFSSSGVANSQPREGQMSVSEELLQRRKDAAERQRRSRANKKDREAEEKERAAQRYFVTQQLVGRGQARPGCPAAGIGGKNPELCPLATCQHFAGDADEWIFSARRFAVASGQPDVQYGESLNSFERRVYGRITTKKVVSGSMVWESRYLSLRTGKLDEEFDAHFDFDPNDQEGITALNVPVDINELPPITATMRVEIYMKALDENRKQAAFEARIAREEAEGLERQKEQEANRLPVSPLAVSLKMQGQERER
jgi:hypothetical protein